METQAFFENIQAQIQTRLLTAETEIDLAVAWFTDRLLFDTVCKKAKTGVNVRLLLFDDDINQYLSFQDLEVFGGKVFRISEKLMHNKFCVIDREVVISGSYNWTKKRGMTTTKTSRLRQATRFSPCNLSKNLTASWNSILAKNKSEKTLGYLNLIENGGKI